MCSRAGGGDGGGIQTEEGVEEEEGEYTEEGLEEEEGETIQSRRWRRTEDGEYKQMRGMEEK